MAQSNFSKIEDSIILLSEAFGFTEREVISIIQDGLAYKYKGNIPLEFTQIIEKLEDSYEI